MGLNDLQWAEEEEEEEETVCICRCQVNALRDFVETFTIEYGNKTDEGRTTNAITRRQSVDV